MCQKISKNGSRKNGCDLVLMAKSEEHVPEDHLEKANPNVCQDLKHMHWAKKAEPRQHLANADKTPKRTDEALPKTSKLSKHMNPTLLQVLKDVVTTDESKLTPEAKLIDDLGCDSLSAVEITMMLEEKLGITIDDEEVSQIVTIQDIINIIESKQ
jgi:acyl carrier protein